MNTVQLNQSKKFDQLKAIFITDKGGIVSFNWKHESCGKDSWNTICGYIGNTPVEVMIDNNDCLHVNGIYHKVEYIN
jgi:hypothetical protein